MRRAGPSPGFANPDGGSRSPRFRRSSSSARRTRYGPPEVLERFLGGTGRLVVVPGADHFFEGALEKVGQIIMEFLAGLRPARPSERGLVTAPAPLSDAARRDLLKLARQTLEAHFRGDPAPRLGSDRSETFGEARGIFVTLRAAGQLRGCIGTLTPEGDLTRMIPEYALRAALSDPRFPPLEASELPGCEIEISVLTPPQRIEEPEEIQVGRDGLIFEMEGGAPCSCPRSPPSGASTASASSARSPARRDFRPTPGAIRTRGSGAFRPRRSRSGSAARANRAGGPPPRRR